MNAREITECLVKIEKLLKSEDYANALDLIDSLLSEDLTDYNRADAYNFKGIALLNLGKYKNALNLFNKSYELDENLIDHKIYDNAFNHANGTDYLRAYNLTRVKSLLKRSRRQRAILYFKKFARENNFAEDDLLDILDIEKNELFDEKPKTILKEEIMDKNFEMMNLAEESISKGDLKKAIFYLDKIPNY